MSNLEKSRCASNEFGAIGGGFARRAASLSRYRIALARIEPPCKSQFPWPEMGTGVGTRRARTSVSGIVYRGSNAARSAP
jgi:hypothetical protein